MASANPGRNPLQVIAKPSELTREQWLELRKKGIGGSEAAAITGYNEYTSPLAIYADKLGLESLDFDNKYTRWGKILEPVILREFPADILEEEGHEVQAEPCDEMLKSDDYPFMLSNPDGRVTWKGERGGLEIKSGTVLQQEKWGEGELPDAHYCQVQHYMAVDKLPFYLVVALLGKDIIWRMVPSNQKFQSDLIEAENVFWYNHVTEQVPPMPVGSADEADHLLSLFPKGEGAISLPHFEDVAGKYRSLGPEINDLKREREKLGNQIKRELGENKIAMCGAYKASWSRYPRKSFDGKKFAKDHPDLYKEYEREKQSGRFGVSEMPKK
jgi:putative phage-type endonuclease